MTDRQVWAEICKWINRLRLNDWGIAWKRIDAEEVEPGVAAKWEGNSDYHQATIILAVKVEDYLIRSRIRHETLHIALDELAEVFRHAEGALAPGERAILHSMWMAAEERTVSRLCRAFEHAERIAPDGIDVV